MRRGPGARLGGLAAAAGALAAIAGAAAGAGAGAGLGAGGGGELELEEALGAGGAWAPAGRLRARLPAEGWGKALAAVVERAPWDAARESALAEVAERDGFVRYRVRQVSGDVMASARARCVSASGFQELFVLHPGAGAHLMGLEYNVPCAPSATGWAGGAPGELPAGAREAIRGGFKQSQAVVRTPRLAPQLQRPQGGQGADAAQGVPGAVSAKAPAEGLEGGEGSAGPRREKEKDDRPWWQKNWMFMLSLGMLLLNVLTKGMDEPGGQQQQRAGGGAPPRRT